MSEQTPNASRTSAPKDTRHPSWLSPVSWLIYVLIALTITAGIVGAVMLSGAQRDRDAAQAHLDDLHRQTEAVRAENTEKSKQLREDSSGLVLDRVERDNNTVGSIMGTATSWDSSESYDEARSELLNEHKIDPKSQFMTEFMPKQKDCNTTAEGEKLCLIDLNDLDSQMVNFHSVVTKIGPTDYTYFGVVDVSTSARDGKSSATYSTPVEYSTGLDGKVKNLRAYASLQEAISTLD